MRKGNINRAIKVKTECAIIAVTAVRDNKIYEKIKESGIKKVLYKPVDFRIL